MTRHRPSSSLPSRLRHALAGAAALAACAVATPTLAAEGDGALGPWPPAEGRVIDRVMAVVNDEPVTYFELRRACAPFVAKAMTEARSRAELEAKIDQIQREVLDNLVNDILVHGEAVKLSLTVTPERIDQHMERIKGANDWTEDELAEQLAKLGYASISDYRRNVEREMLKSQAISIRVTSRVKVDEREVEEELQRRLGAGGTVEERRAAHIMMRVSPDAGPAEEARVDKVLREVRARILSGELTFADAAREFSDDANKSSGGDLGWFSRGDFDPDFEKVAFAMEENTLSEPIRTQFGYHIIAMVGVRRSQGGATEEELEKLRQTIRYEIQSRELERLYAQWVKGLRAQAFVEIKDPDFAREPGARPQI